MILRAYHPDQDHEAVQRIWLEIGWMAKGQEAAMDQMLATGACWVAEVHGAAECLVTTSAGAVRYQDVDLPFGLIATVTTSRVARKQGFAGRAAAHAVAEFARQGALVAGLGIFDQGYYDHLGFGTLTYEHFFNLDPARLNVPAKARPPRRLTEDDWEAVHASRLARTIRHGYVNHIAPAHTRAAMLFATNGFGLGYFDGPAGELTHHLWVRPDNVGRGPYRIQWMAYQNRAQFLELMALLKTWDDQIYQIAMREPPDVQLQDLIHQPFRQRWMSDKSAFEMSIHTNAVYQMRICDLAGCLARTRLRCEPLRFNLSLSDPIGRYLPADSPWRGVAGQYVLTLGAESSAREGRDEALPTLQTTVNAFTRLWLGVRPATSLAMTDTLDAPPDLLDRLDQAFCLPAPKPDWNL
jgi:predicted acetyltransferase